MIESKPASDLSALKVRKPIRTLKGLNALEEREILEGYWDGYDGEPEPGDNRSLSYWHGWRNGAVDGGHREADEAQAALAHEVVASWGINK